MGTLPGTKEAISCRSWQLRCTASRGDSQKCILLAQSVVVKKKVTVEHTALRSVDLPDTYGGGLRGA